MTMFMIMYSISTSWNATFTLFVELTSSLRDINGDDVMVGRGSDVQRAHNCV
jgi:hypothetical protein